jgi:hypothetical protein
LSVVWVRVERLLDGEWRDGLLNVCGVIAQDHDQLIYASLRQGHELSLNQGNAVELEQAFGSMAHPRS